MSRFAKLLATVGATICFAGGLHATGYFEPQVYLDQGGKNVDGTPEFYWGLEVRRLAKEFHPSEKLVVLEKPKPESDEETSENKAGTQDTDAADLKDFEAALNEGRIKPPDPKKATELNKLARDTITSSSPVEEFDSEFADYHRGASAYLNKQWDQARKAWEDLLKRPEQDRHYRTVWAAFMLGKLALKTSDYKSASEWFQRTRELAAAGFADSLGLAAESYGWEGRSEWKQDHPEKAAPLFLTQLALGDASAVVSLKALIPDREPIRELLNYGPEPDERESWNEEQKREQEQKEISKLKAAAQDPLLRRLVTVHILATASSPDLYSGDSSAAPVNRCARWLNIIKQANIGKVEDAEYLGWVAYNNGDYKGAAHWLELSKGDSGAALWLRAKLQRRAGKLPDAANTMAQAVEWLKSSPAYTAPGGVDETWTEYDFFPEGYHWGWGQSSPTEPPKEGEDYNAKLRYLLGRRLVREDRYAEAAPYLPKPYDKVLEKYVKVLQDGANEKLSKTERAHAWFTAAWIARYDGMELMGTEVAPDAFAESGEFETPDIAKQLRSGVYQTVSYDKDGNEKKKNLRVVLKASPKEIRRLNANKINPDIRFHYRLVAGALAIKAAALLPTDSEELADVVNQAGLWVKDRDEKTGNRYYQIIEQRGAKTNIGRADIAKHWFVDQSGPWSTAEEEAYRALHKQLEPERSSE
ncbi:MAG: hypothetical protein DMF07_04215 [Verrucomicrobia bacterium]|nr:MAG: hypothetical protein DMF07_04215 [Verrucomicrobiota bacterium]